MRGSTASDRRADQLQALTFLGLLVDDVSLATIHYPELDDPERRALAQLASWLRPSQGRDVRIRRRKSIGDPTEILYQAAALSHQTEDTEGAAPSLDFLTAPLQKLIDGKASPSDVAVVKGFAHAISRVTLALTEQLVNEKGSQDWTPAASSFSVRP